MALLVNPMWPSMTFPSTLAHAQVTLTIPLIRSTTFYFDLITDILHHRSVFDGVNTLWSHIVIIPDIS